MATLLSSGSTQRAQNGAQKAISFHPAQRIGDLSRIVDHDIELLKTNLEQLHDGRDEARSSALESLEIAWENVRSELPDDAVARHGPASAAAQVDAPTPIRRAVRWTCERARRAEFRSVVSKAWRSASNAAVAGAQHASNGWSGLRAAVRRRAKSFDDSRGRVKGRGKASHAADSYGAIEGESGGVCSSAWEEGAQLRLEGAMETAKSALALIEGASRPIPAARSKARPDDLAANSPDAPFVLHPIPWVLGALSPVISARTMMLHGAYHAECAASANRLARDHEGLAGKDSLEVVRWASEHVRNTELHSMASEAWNHAFYWKCLTPVRKRPSGELGKALDRMFGGYPNFADKFALAGTAHSGSGWLWLTANRRKQVRILTTSGADCPEARGHTCLLAVDLWEHAYYLDHPNRCREYLDALIDRRLDWDFAEQRFRLFLQRESEARGKTPSRVRDGKRSRLLKGRKATTLRH